MLFRKKKQQTGAIDAVTPASILILGTGCAKCQTLFDNTQRALQTMGLQEPVAHITDYRTIASYGVMSTPALVVDGTVLTAGRTLAETEIIELLTNAGRKPQ